MKNKMVKLKDVPVNGKVKLEGYDNKSWEIIQEKFKSESERFFLLKTDDKDEGEDDHLPENLRGQSLLILLPENKEVELIITNA